MFCDGKATYATLLPNFEPSTWTTGERALDPPTTPVDGGPSTGR